MGWYGEPVSRRDKIAALTRSHSQANCLRHCYRGNNFRGVLWGVWEATPEGEAAHPGNPTRAISCDLLEYRDGMWFNKPLSESCHPYYYSCPLGYLDMVPVANAAWREEVRKYHAKPESPALRDGMRIRFTSVKYTAGDTFRAIRRGRAWRFIDDIGRVVRLVGWKRHAFVEV